MPNAAADGAALLHEPKNTMSGRGAENLQIVVAESARAIHARKRPLYANARGAEFLLTQRQTDLALAIPYEDMAGKLDPKVGGSPPRRKSIEFCKSI